MYRNDSMFSVMGLALLLVLLVLSQKSRDGVVVLMGMFGSEQQPTEAQVASVSEAYRQTGPLSIAVSLVHETNRQVYDNVRAALSIDSLVVNMLVSSFYSVVQGAKHSLTPTLHDARFVRDTAFPVVASIPQAQVVKEASKGLARDFTEGALRSQASALAVFDDVPASDSVLTPATKEDSKKILDSVLPIFDTASSYLQKGITYCLTQVAYLLPDYAKQAQVLMEAGGTEALYLWSNKGKFLDALRN